MPCYSPLYGCRGVTGGISWSPRSSYVDVQMQVPCGQCIGCRLERSRQWAVRMMHEAQMHEDNSFVTLTYDDEHLPDHGSLQRPPRDFQLFMKRLRKFYGKERISFYQCGEYGSENGRPHHHAILFGVAFPDQKKHTTNGRGDDLFVSPTLDRLWGLGLATIGALTFESAAYCARYCVKKVTGQQALFFYERVDPATGEVYRLVPEYATMSLNPGIGERWFKKYGAELEDNDSVVMRGYEMSVPRYYNRKRRKADAVKYVRVRKERMFGLYRCRADLTEARLKVKERVKLSQVNFLGRKL